MQIKLLWTLSLFMLGPFSGPSTRAEIQAGSCLKSGDRTSLQGYVQSIPFADKTPEDRAFWEMNSPEWQAARAAALAWSRNDCQAFAEAASVMGYTAELLRDTASNTSYWVLGESPDKAEPVFQGVFVFRSPHERAQTRPLVIDAPHMGFDYSARDPRALRTFIESGAAVYLQNTAHRCSSTQISGCSAVSNYACGEGGMRESDVVHSVRQAYYAIYDGIESSQNLFHFEYHGAGASNNVEGCPGTAHISQASSRKLSKEVDAGTFPNRFWTALESRWGAACVCYHQREAACKLNGASSTAGQRTNLEVAQAQPPPMDACLAQPTALAQRFIHFEGYRVDETVVIQALKDSLDPGW